MGQQCAVCQSGYEGFNCQVKSCIIVGVSSTYDQTSASQQHSLLYLLFLLLIIPVFLVILVAVVIIVTKGKRNTKPKEPEQEMATVENITYNI